jgi:electron transfer flavoprotein alpha subunit
MTVLVIGEHDGQSVKPATHNTVAAALAIEADVHLLIAGDNCQGAVEHAARMHGVSRVIKADSAAYANALAENLAPLIVDLAQSYSHVMAPASTFGKNIMPRAAALLDVQQISDISEVIAADTFVRPIYAGNALATVTSADPIKLITVRTTAFEAVDESGQAEIVDAEVTADAGLSKFLGQEFTRSERPELTTAGIVISGGRGMQSGENFAMLERVADKLGAAVGASRAAVDAGYVPNDYQVGQTGKVVAPELYIAVGISGAIQHLAGMKDSKYIVAINKDEEAPIFQVADYGWVADLFTAVPELEDALDSE